MIFGSCTSDPSNLARYDAYGYGIYEANFQYLLEMSEEEFAAFSRDIKQYRARLAGMNCFARPDTGLLLKTEAEVDAYFESGIKRFKPLGLEYIVIGSGGARKIPEGMSHEEGHARLVAMLRRFGDIAGKYDVNVYFEPLREHETNNVNTVIEGIAACREVNHPRVGLVADFYHMKAVGEAFSDIRECGDYLRHIHVATADRRIPLCADRDEIEPMAQLLKEIGYQGYIVLEGGGIPDEETAMREFATMFSMFE